MRGIRNGAAAGLRYAVALYFVGIVALIWAPETKGQPLPED